MIKVILSVDPGEKNIGLAKSDPLGIGATVRLRIATRVTTGRTADRDSRSFSSNLFLRII